MAAELAQGPSVAQMEGESPSRKELKFPEFDDIPVSTMTFTATTNLKIDLEKLYESLPVTEYVVVPKRRGRKKKTTAPDPNANIPSGSIITIKYKSKLRGVDLKGAKRWFRNSFTVVIVLDKKVNFKICTNGTFQMTGCKSLNHALQCLPTIWNHIKDKMKKPKEEEGTEETAEEDPGVYEFRYGDSLEALFIPAMRNIDFSLGFNVDREKLSSYMTGQSEYRCLLETSLGYTGVNIKIPLKQKITDMIITRCVFDTEGKCEDCSFDSQGKCTKCPFDSDGKRTEEVSYSAYLDLLSVKERSAKLNVKRYNTFLVFHSGKVIMSGATADFMRETYNEFLDVVRGCHTQIEERLETD